MLARRDANQRPRSATQSVARARQLDYVNEIIRRTGKTPSSIAREIGRSTTTLTRFLQPDYDGTLLPIILQELADWSGMPAPDAAPAQARGFREEAAPYVGERGAEPDLVEAAIGSRPDAHGWLVKVDMLGVAIRKGDVVVVDQAAKPAPGDVVCCQFEDGLTVTTVFRVFHPPFLIGTSTDPAGAKPELANDDTRRIVGVVTDVIRRRPA